MRNLIKRENVLYPELSYLVCGLCFVTQNRLGRFRSERQYADFLEGLFQEHRVKYQREVSIPQSFSGEHANRNRPDFIVEDNIIVDLKAKRLISRDDYFQMRRYLVSSGKELGLLVNFRPRYVVIKRVLGPRRNHS